MTLLRPKCYNRQVDITLVAVQALLKIMNDRIVMCFSSFFIHLKFFLCTLIPQLNNNMNSQQTIKDFMFAHLYLKNYYVECTTALPALK